MNINELPNEVLLHIFSYLNLESVLICENICFRWNELIHSPAIWNGLRILYSRKREFKEVHNNELCKQVLFTHSLFIRHIKLQYIDDYDLIVNLLRPCQNLVKLELTMCRIKKKFAEELLCWPHLQKLELKNVLLPLEEREFLVPFQNMKELRYLCLSDFGLTTNNITDLKSCNLLSNIYIEKITNLAQSEISFLIEMRKGTLKALHIYGGEALDDSLVDLICNCMHLEDLAIIRCEYLSDNSLQSISNMKKCKHLQLWNNKRFSEKGLYVTFSNPNLFDLESLSLSRIKNVSPMIMDVISLNYISLKYLSLYLCPKISEDSEYVNQIEHSLFTKASVFIVH